MVSTRVKALVFFMHLGFSFLEIGLTRQKNTVNILFKNFFVITIGILLYALGGFNLMYPGFDEGSMGILKFAGFGIGAPEGGMTPGYADGGYTWWTDFLFQAVFAATAATIVSGAVAERIKLGGFMLFTILYVGLVYPIIGSWKWGGGFLDQWGFYDFAGSTLVHSVGGWAALIAVYLLGARVGKFGSDGKPKAIPGHNIPVAAAGVLKLWLGWFGFNGGSVLSADPELKKTLNELPSRFGTHSRTNDEAVLSYKIAIQTLAIMDELQPDQDTKLELLTLGLLCSEKLEKLGRSEESLEQKIETLKRIGDPTSGLDKANRIRVIFWKCLLELETGQKKKASISLRQLESLALGRETDLYTANLLDQSLKKARKALLKMQT